MLQRLVLLVIAVLSLAACNFSNVRVEQGGDGTTNVTITLTEAEVNTIIQNALNNSANPLLRNPSIDLQPGQIVISGEHDRRDGGGRISGTVTLTATVIDGDVLVQITSAQIDGWDATDARIEQFNQQLAQGLGGRARQNNPRATLTNITITDTQLQITINVQTQN